MPGIAVFHCAGFPVSTRLPVVPEPVPRGGSGGRPALCAEKETICPAPASGGTLPRLTISGMGSSTVTDWVTDLQPAALHTRRVTCLTPGEENTTLGF